MKYPTIDMRATGNNIRVLRKKKGITAQQIADFMGFAEPVAVYKWQRGDSLPTLDNLLALARLMDCSMEDILVEDDEMSSFHIWNFLNADSLKRMPKNLTIEMICF